MIKCAICKRQTESGKVTGQFTHFVKVIYSDGTEGKEAMKQEKTCLVCSGEKMEGGEHNVRRKTGINQNAREDSMGDKDGEGRSPKRESSFRQRDVSRGMQARRNSFR